jgi:hypothetical protein
MLVDLDLHLKSRGSASKISAIPNFREKIRKFSLKLFFPNYFWYQRSAANLGYACENLGGLGPLVLEEIENAQTQIYTV